LLLVPFIDYLLKKLSINVTPLRSVTYFIGMNIALLAGFWWYIKGIKSSVWQPTERK
jgi:hypothetical protein